MRTRIAVLASGRGSNLQSLVQVLAERDAPSAGEVVMVASDRPASGALAWARQHGMTAVALDTGPSHSALLDELLLAHAVDIVVLAGYLRLVPAEVVRRFRGRMVNVHPALLPAFGGPGMYGERVHRAVIASGARVSGPTVHFVTERYDEGPIIAQWPVPVYADDTAEALGARVLRVEHSLLPHVVGALAAGRIALEPDNRVRGVFGRSLAAAFALVPMDDVALADAIETALAGR